MATIASAAFAETPERVLLRVKQLEDVELPSLPSFQHDDDYDDESEKSTSFEQTINITGEHDEFVSAFTWVVLNPFRIRRLLLIPSDDITSHLHIPAIHPIPLHPSVMSHSHQYMAI
jgi:hypothetical protein